MKSFNQLFFCGLLNVLVIYFLSIEIAFIPPLGRFFNPFEGFWQIKEISNDKIIQVLASKAKITFDANQIPTIISQNDYDLYFSQGYIIAKDRLCQLDFQSRVASGRLSEIFGKKCLEFDRLQRRNGLAELAKSAAVLLESDEKISSVLQAYVDGINAYIDSLDYKYYPIEYKLINYSPKKFSILDVVNILVLLIDDMSGSSNAIEHTIDFYNLGEAKFNLFFPDKLNELYPVVEINKVLKKPASTKSVSHQLPIISEEILTFKGQIQCKNEDAGGSNSWAVNNKKSYNNSIYLANDPHLRISLPSIWYVNTLKSPTIEVTGFSVPGLPGVLIGANKSIAWGMTNACLNIKGWYKISFKDKTRKEYYYDDKILKTQIVEEKINIKNSEPFCETVLYTHLGPLVYDRDFAHKSGMTDLAMKWFDGSIANAFACMFKINRADSYAKFEASVMQYVAPIINFTLAAREGDIAIHVAGTIPNLFDHQSKFIMPGSASEYEWVSNIPYSDRPMVLNPSNNFVCSANQRITNSLYPYYYLHYANYQYRNKRIHQLLASQNNLSMGFMQKMQNDTFNQIAKDNLDFLLSSLDRDLLTAEEQNLYKHLASWNLSNECSKLAPSIFREWDVQINKILWKKLYPCLVRPSTYRTFEILKNEGLYNCLDFKDYQNPKSLMRTAFTRTLKTLTKFEKNKQKSYIWGNYRKFEIEHLYKLKPFGLYNIKVDGGRDIINANEGHSGASMRMIVEFKTENNSPNISYIYPGGQSGNPFSKYYDNLMHSWQNGSYSQLSLD